MSEFEDALDEAVENGEITEAEARADLISRQAAIDAVEKAVFKGVAKAAIESLPSVEPKRPKGEWIGYNADKEDWLRADGTPIFLVCDKCHGTVINNGSAHWNFCPNCGADMKGDKG